MFVSTVQNAFSKRDGDRIAQELRDFYLTNLYRNVPEKSWNVNINQNMFQGADAVLGVHYAKMF